MALPDTETVSAVMPVSRDEEPLAQYDVVNSETGVRRATATFLAYIGVSIVDISGAPMLQRKNENANGDVCDLQIRK